MADLGDISVRLLSNLQALWDFPDGEKAVGTVWNRPNLQEPEINNVYSLAFSYGVGTKQLSGVVGGDQSDFTQVLVRAYRKASGQLAGATYAAADGTFSIEVDGDIKQFFVIAFDPEGGNAFNAVIQDKIFSA